MRKVLDIAKRFRDDEDGAAMVEYTILLGIITAVVITSVIAVGTWVGGQWTFLQGKLESVPDPV
ncbi:Flp family type IVb pilin [Pseudaminobacter arsenicus]|uniref:Flp family type IVb pilin n=1 Tax=Borborobacter arsenicus TaxID=1851146 RepID=A0A432V6W9_9HYPH|nr:Flp family type IVb pilin [Pseudaminobacter arsenicus]RUM97924.1 Flp family type IVb pilin [Pseudaminobacter arsenicus]